MSFIKTNKDYKTTSINNYFEFLTGFKKEEVIGKDTIELMSGKEYKKNIYNILKNIFEGKNNDVYSESSLLTKDGEEKLIAWKDSLVVTGEMEPVILSIGIDITEKKKSEKKIKRNLELESSLNEIRNIIEFRDFDKFKSIAEILFSTINIDRFEIIEYETKLNNFHRDIYEYSKDGKTSLKKEIVSSTSESISWVKNTLLKNNTIEVLNVSKLDSSFKIKDFLLRNNIRSFITISLIIKNELYAAITFNLFDNNDKDWLECDIEYIKKVGIILKNELRNIIQFKKVEKTLNDTVNTLSSVVQMRDAYTSSHQMRVSNLAVSIAKKMNLSDEKIKNIEVASKLHDIGKINIPGEILSKPGKINDLEFSLIKEHCKYGYNILQKIDFEGPIAEIVYQHHERIDGSGYPRGLKNKEILLESKIIAVSDVVEAMMSHRPYRKALGIKKALKEIDEFSGIKFDKDVVDACLDLFNNDNYNLPKINGDFN